MAVIAGLKLIVPSSVAGSGVSVSASGKVTFTAATTVSVNGCFSATYDNYLMVMRYRLDGAGAPDLQIRLRASGSDNSTANSYRRQQLEASGATASGGRATADIARLSELPNDQRSGLHLNFYGPYLAQPTAARSINAGGRNSATILEYAWTHNQSTAYDGFTLSNSSNAAWSGALTIYGLSQ
jgi:hypothetical protein